MFSKIRSNVIILAAMMTGVISGLIVGLFLWLDTFNTKGDFWEGAVVGGIVALFLTLIGVTVGNLGSVMSHVAQDPAPPAVPESSLAVILDKLTTKK